MKNTTYVSLAIATAVAGAFIGAAIAHRAGAEAATKEEPPQAIEEPALTHAQEVWISALEWCESRGKVDAINPKDRDNTPSYYSFQFKPETFLGYGLEYGILPATTTIDSAAFTEAFKSWEQQRAVVAAMVLHRDEIDWEQQFPDCVKRKIGMPPPGYPPKAI